MAIAQTRYTVPLTEVGTLGGECFRAFCQTTGANWHHSKADRYYCESCAAEINLHSWFKGEPPACTPHR